MSRKQSISPLGVLAAISLSVAVVGCGKPYEPKPLTPEQQQLKNQYSQFGDALRKAMGQSGRYVQVAIVDRSTMYPENDKQYTRVLVLHREKLDLDDFGFSLPGKEESESDSDHIEGFFNEIYFWTDKEGVITFDDFAQPPGTQMVVEWSIPNNAGEKISLHYGGNPCIVLDLKSN